MIHREQPIPTAILLRVKALLEEGVVESLGRGKSARYILSRQYYVLAGKEGVYTRKRGLDRETNKELLFKHIRDSASSGSRLETLRQVVPSLSRGQVQTLLREMAAEGRIRKVGATRAALWYPGHIASPIASRKQSPGTK